MVPGIKYEQSQKLFHNRICVSSIFLFLFVFLYSMRQDCFASHENCLAVFSRLNNQFSECVRLVVTPDDAVLDTDNSEVIQCVKAVDPVLDVPPNASHSRLMTYRIQHVSIYCLYYQKGEKGHIRITMQTFNDAQKGSVQERQYEQIKSNLSDFFDRNAYQVHINQHSLLISCDTGVSEIQPILQEALYTAELMMKVPSAFFMQRDIRPDSVHKMILDYNTSQMEVFLYHYGDKNAVVVIPSKREQGLSGAEEVIAELTKSIQTFSDGEKTGNQTQIFMEQGTLNGSFPAAYVFFDRGDQEETEWQPPDGAVYINGQWMKIKKLDHDKRGPHSRVSIQLFPQPDKMQRESQDIWKKLPSMIEQLGDDSNKRRELFAQKSGAEEHAIAYMEIAAQLLPQVVHIDRFLGVMRYSICIQDDQWVQYARAAEAYTVIDHKAQQAALDKMQSIQSQLLGHRLYNELCLLRWNGSCNERMSHPTVFINGLPYTDYIQALIALQNAAQEAFNTDGNPFFVFSPEGLIEGLTPIEQYAADEWYYQRARYNDHTELLQARLYRLQKMTDGELVRIVGTEKDPIILINEPLLADPTLKNVTRKWEYKEYLYYELIQTNTLDRLIIALEKAVKVSWKGEKNMYAVNCSLHEILRQIWFLQEYKKLIEKGADALTEDEWKRLNAKLQSIIIPDAIRDNFKGRTCYLKIARAKDKIRVCRLFGGLAHKLGRYCILLTQTVRQRMMKPSAADPERQVYSLANIMDMFAILAEEWGNTLQYMAEFYLEDGSIYIQGPTAEQVDKKRGIIRRGNEEQIFIMGNGYGNAHVCLKKALPTLELIGALVTSTSIGSLRNNVQPRFVSSERSGSRNTITRIIDDMPPSIAENKPPSIGKDTPLHTAA